MNISLFYFSGTGYTKAVCDLFVRKCEQAGCSVTAVNIEDFLSGRSGGPDDLAADTDLFGFAYPVYGADLPQIYSRFLDALNGFSFGGKPAFALSVAAHVNGYGPFLFRRRLEKAGLVLRNHVVCRMPDSTRVIKNGRPDQETYLRRSERTLDRLIRDLKAGITRYTGIGPWIIGGYIVRKFLARPLREHYKHFYIDETRCTRCMRCLKNCPTQSIVFANGFFFFKNSCTTCFRCRNSCLAGAIREKNK